NLKIKVPAVPLGWQAWEVAPGRVRSHHWTRKLGGNEIELKEFCLTSAVVFTSDLTGLVVQFQKQQRETANAASQWSYDLAAAERALRPVRILMRAHWEEAVKPLGGVAVASPYAVSFYTLPRHWQFWDQVGNRQPANNVLTDGDFELPLDRVPEGWGMQMIP